MSDFSEGDTLKLVLFSDSHGNVANMADVVRLEHPDRVLHMGIWPGMRRSWPVSFPIFL